MYFKAIYVAVSRAFPAGEMAVVADETSDMSLFELFIVKGESRRLLLSGSERYKATGNLHDKYPTGEEVVHLLRSILPAEQ